MLGLFHRGRLGGLWGVLRCFQLWDTLQSCGQQAAILSVRLPLRLQLRPQKGVLSLKASNKTVLWISIRALLPLIARGRVYPVAPVGVPLVPYFVLVDALAYGIFGYAHPRGGLGNRHAFRTFAHRFARPFLSFRVHALQPTRSPSDVPRIATEELRGVG